MTTGQTFKIKPEWCDSEAEKSLTYHCTGSNEATSKVYGQTFDTGLSIVPVECFEARMIEETN